jgi:hypothetical protein
LGEIENPAVSEFERFDGGVATAVSFRERRVKLMHGEFDFLRISSKAHEGTPDFGFPVRKSNALERSQGLKIETGHLFNFCSLGDNLFDWPVAFFH